MSLSIFLESKNVRNRFSITVLKVTKYTLSHLFKGGEKYGEIYSS
jgi:hypothetical protein